MSHLTEVDVSLPVRVALGLVLGLAAGVGAKLTGNTALAHAGSVIEPVGALWLNAILMTVVPLVVSTLIVGVASTEDTRLVGRLGRRAGLMFVLFVVASAVLTALVAPPLVARLPFAAGETLIQGTPLTTRAPSMRDWLVSVIPSNPVRAAADGAMLPLVVFTLVFALALTRVERAARESLVGFFAATAAAMRVIVQWVIALAPIGVFALSYPLAARIGAAAAGALGWYVALVVALSVSFIALLYAVVAIGAGVSPRTFARAALPAQAVAFGSRSSLAALPALIDGATRTLGVPASVASFALPLAVSAFKIGMPVTVIVGVLVGGRLFGVPIEAAQIVEAAAAAALLSFAVPGIPGGSLLVAAPVFTVCGLPVEALGVLLAVDVVPDMARTPLNVTADLVVATLLGRDAPEEEPPGVRAPESLPELREERYARAPE